MGGKNKGGKKYGVKNAKGFSSILADDNDTMIYKLLNNELTKETNAGDKNNVKKIKTKKIKEK